MTNGDISTFQTAEEYIFYEEKLLKDAGTDTVLLRFWEPQTDIVVLGKSNQAEREVYVDRCRQDGIPIVKRCSGGGTVLQTKGVLNYSIIAPQFPPFDRVQSSNKEVMEIIKSQLQTETVPIEIQGYTDLTYKGKKWCGNAQKRTLTHFLFHGSMLIDADIQKISHYLKHPSREPAYRKSLSHADFLCNVPLDKEQIKKGLKKAIAHIKQMRR